MNVEFKKKFKIQKLSVVDFKHWVLSVRPQQITLGSMVISLKRECNSLGELSADESKELNLVFYKTESLLKKAFQFDKINYLCLMMVDKQVHFHVIPRYSKPVSFLGNDYPDHSWPNPPEITNVIKEQTITIKVYNSIVECYKEKKLIIGYTTGVFDLFHIGHLNVLRKAKDHCDILIVGVCTDELAFELKNKTPVIPFNERVEVVSNISCVDFVVPEISDEKIDAWHKIHFDVIFKGDDWKGSDKWTYLESEFFKLGVKVKYFTHTKNTSSTLIHKALEVVDK